MSKKVILLLANGFEDVEAVTPIDYLRRAGIEVTTASITNDLIVTSRWGQIKLIADTSLEQLGEHGVDDWDAILLPGGMPGVENLAACEKAVALVKKMAAAGKLICAICAAPVFLLAPLGILNGKKFTCYTGLEEKVDDAVKPLWVAERVVVDGNIITSRAAGTAGEWSIAIIKALLGEEAANKIARTVLL